MEKKRLVLVAGSIFFLFSLLIAQFFKIQILEKEKWSKEALSQHEFMVREPCKRGAFFSNTDLKKNHPEPLQPFVFDVAKSHLYIDPLSITESKRKEVCENLILLAHLENNVAEEFFKKSRSRKIGSWLDREIKEKILSWWLPYAKKEKLPSNAIYFVGDYQRSYPFGKLLGQVLHTIRERKDELTQEGYPTGGLESFFNETIKGKAGKRKLLRSPLNQLEIDKEIEAPVDGADIYLTVNHCIQAIAEEELEKGVKAARALGGWAVMMDPRTGEILALAQYPFFDPANYREYFNDPEKIERAKVKPITDCFELGSIMKPITLSIALKANKELATKGKKPIFHQLEKIDVTRTRFPGRMSKPLTDVPPHRALNMYMALQKSSNIYMAQIIERIIQECGNDWYRKNLVDVFGFDHKTGIELPGETQGKVPLPGKLHPSGALEWSTPTPFSLAIGYNILATSLQMLRAYAIFANNGYLVKPTLIRKIIQKDKVLFDHSKDPPFPKVLEDEIVRDVVTAMKFSTKPGGTGHFASIAGYTEAGKTGTAEKIVGGVYSKERYISSFIGFTPVSFNPKNPSRFVLMVSIDEPAPILLEGGVKNYLGGRCAAPVFREIAKRTLEYLGIPPDDPYGYPVGDPRYDSEKADWMKEVTELKSLYDKWNAK